MIDKPQNTRPRAGRRRKSTLVGSKQSGMLRVPKFSNLRFSVVIGTKNPNSVFLKEALESCNGLFEEVIIVNDGSDRPILPAEKLEKLVSQGVKIINHKRNLGFYEARNTGIREATGDIIASLDDDDVFDPIGVSHLRNFISGQPDCDIYHFPIQIFGEQTGLWGHEYDYEKILECNQIPSGSWFKKSAWTTLLGFQYPLAEDWDFWARAMKAGLKFKYFDRPVYYYRSHRDSLSYNWKGEKLETIRSEVRRRYKLYTLASSSLSPAGPDSANGKILMNGNYTEDFYGDINEGSRRSAEAIVPAVIDFVKPKSVIDVGCGEGVWLSVFRECGVQDVLGVDGSWVNEARLTIPRDQFQYWDLEKPLRLKTPFDLAMSLEVAEHLAAEHALTFVESLTRHAPVILFSAAIPHQGGRNHLNEQWPEYWAKLFDEQGYVAIDCLRTRFWRSEDVEWWYAQNILLFGRRDYVEAHPLLRKEWEKTCGSPLSIVHPKLYSLFVEKNRLELVSREIISVIPAGDVFILVDQEELGKSAFHNRSVLPFLERNGQYWGPPPDDTTAIQEFERLRQTGATFIVFAWPAFWWLDYYSGLRDYLRSNFRCVLENERLVLFDLREGRSWLTEKRITR